jgi:hypothetical protein
MSNGFKHSNKKCKGTARIIIGSDGIQRYVCDKCCPQGLTITELLAQVLGVTEQEAVKTAFALSHILKIPVEEAIRRLFNNGQNI